MSAFGGYREDLPYSICQFSNKNLYNCQRAVMRGRMTAPFNET